MHPLHYVFVLFHFVFYSCDLPSHPPAPECMSTVYDIYATLAIQSAVIIMYTTYQNILHDQIQVYCNSCCDMLFLCVAVQLAIQTMPYNIKFAYIFALHAPFSLISKRLPWQWTLLVVAILALRVFRDSQAICCSSLVDTETWLYHFVNFAAIDVLYPSILRFFHILVKTCI